MRSNSENGYYQDYIRRFIMKKYRDEIAMVCHEIVRDGQSIGLVNEKEMREFEENCFVEESEATGDYQPSAERVRQWRSVSQLIL
jgi:hypothetical protein